MKYSSKTICQYCDSQTWKKKRCCAKKVLANGLQRFEEQRSEASSAVVNVDRALSEGQACMEMYHGLPDNPEIWSAFKQLQGEASQFSQVSSDVLKVLDTYQQKTRIKLERLSDPNDPVWITLRKTHDTCAKVLSFLAYCGEALVAYAGYFNKSIKNGKHVSEPEGLGAWLHRCCPWLAACLEDLGHSLRSNNIAAAVGCVCASVPVVVFIAGGSAAQVGATLLVGGGLAVLAAGLFYTVSAIGRDITLAKKQPYCAAIQEVMAMRIDKQANVASEEQVEAILQVFSKCLDRPVFVDTEDKRILSTAEMQTCAVCMEKVRPRQSIVVSAANPQCSTNHWLHERCYKSYAAAPGVVASKCPSCQVLSLDVVKTLRVKLLP